MKSKPKRATAWLPNQVTYGMDVSDPDPKNWFPFGEIPEREQSQATGAKRASSATADQRQQSAP